MKKIKLQLYKSLIGRLKSHVACANALGLKKIQQIINITNTPEHQGMINKIKYLLKIRDI